jgi:hypothetical protein
MLEARVLAAPVLVPSGLATECMLALGHAVPLVTTPLGARGLLTARSPGAIAIARTSDEFAAALVSLLLDRSAWDAQRARSVHHAAAHLGAPRLHRQLRLLLLQWRQRCLQQPSWHFLGQLQQLRQLLRLLLWFLQLPFRQLRRMQRAKL